ncbi:MAG: LPS export ABC transporter periplasmic protein LptC [Candidatus Omnitrophica bacterium]|nr:LPS export ABC transporter periplasmic protein LptC [Candidatus Omnitrophota bacterium]
MKSKIFLIFIFLIFSLSVCYAQQTETDGSVTVNADTVEYSLDGKEVSAEGNVVVVYKETKLTCRKLKVNIETKDAEAEGDVRIEDSRGIIEGKRLTYNLNTKAGIMVDSEFRANPYFGKAKEIERINETHFVAQKGYATTCSYDFPHYRIGAKQLDIFPNDKIRSQHDTVYLGKLPILYLPGYSRSLKDLLMHVQFMPGKHKDWGPYLLSAWRYNLTDYASGRIYLDWRQDLGVAEGFGLNYKTNCFGSGDYKYYYTQERDRRLSESGPREFQRYLIRWRHRWEIDNRTNVNLEYYKIQDSKRQLGGEHNFLKDYFFREYEKDIQPKTYLLFTHAFDYASLSLFVQKRVNRWYDTTVERLPEVYFSLPEYKIYGTPLYFKNSIMVSNLTEKNPAPSDSDKDVVRFDTYNHFSLPVKLSFLWLNPFIGIRQTFYSKDINGDSLDPRTVFYSGLDLSTKFYRLFDFNSNFLGLDINGLRHVVSPVLRFTYIHQPTIPSYKLQEFDDIDRITKSNKIDIELVNKLQTKRTDATKVDLVTLKVSTDYKFKPKGGSGSSFSDFLFDLELVPYAWLRFEADAIYDHFGDNFKQVNLDNIVNLGKDRSLGFGQRYERRGGKELTSELNWRFSPKWKFRTYQRYQFAQIRNKGLKEQEYSFIRDLHCWIMEFTYNIQKDKGHTVWIVFRLKAFPELECSFNQSYHAPKSSSSNP